MTPLPSDPWAQTGSGRAVPLMSPCPADIDFEVDVPEALARLPRFTGHARSGPFSVAQHSCLGADALIAEGRGPLAAFAFLLHDAHEAYLGDIATPVAQALACETFALGGLEAAMAARNALRALKARFDDAIFAAAGLVMTDELALAVKDMDRRMLEAERRRLLPPCHRPWSHDAGPPPKSPSLRGNVWQVWPWPHAADEWRARFERWRPARPALTPRPPRPVISAARKPVKEAV